MYHWDLVGHDTSEGSLCSGLGDDLAATMRIVEPLLVKRVGFAVRIVEAEPRLSVFHLGAIHVPTGREWLGRRDIHGGVYWEASCRSVDSSVAYHLAAGKDTGAIASLEGSVPAPSMLGYPPSSTARVRNDRRMRLRIFTEPQQGASYATLRSVAKAAEDLGFDAFFRSDHYLKMGSVSGEPGPSDAWATLAGLAVETSRIRLGTLVTSATFRHPGPLAVAVANIDEMSGGRVELGIGAGWYAGEHAAYGIPFPPTKERFDRLEEQLAIITGLWETPVGGKFSYDGLYYQVLDSPGLPKPVQRPRPPVIIGGHGPRRTPALAANYASEFNIAFSNLGEVAEQFGRVREACVAAGRDAASLAYSVAQVVCCGKDEATLSRRAAAIGRDVPDLRVNGLAGSPAEIVDKIGTFAEAGAQTVYLQVLDLGDLDQLAEIAADVLPQV